MSEPDDEYRDSYEQDDEDEQNGEEFEPHYANRAPGDDLAAALVNFVTSDLGVSMWGTAVSLGEQTFDVSVVEVPTMDKVGDPPTLAEQIEAVRYAAQHFIRLEAAGEGRIEALEEAILTLMRVEETHRGDGTTNS